MSLDRARAVFVIGRCMRDRLLTWDLPDNKLLTATLWANEQTVYPIAPQDNDLRRTLGLQDCFTIMYGGNLGSGHYFDDIVEVARRLKGTSTLRFVFAGAGSRRAEIEAAKARYDLDNVVLLPFQPEAMLAQSLSMGDVHFISLREGYEGLMVPSKAYGVFNAGRSTIYQGNRAGEIAREIAEHEMGTVLSPGDPDQLEAIILKYYTHPEIARREGENALAAARSIFDREQSTGRYRHAIEALVELRR